MADSDDFPPGTVRLESHRSSSSHIIRQPTPTADPNDPLNWSMLRKVVNFGLANFFVVNTFVLLDIGVVAYGPYGDMGISYNEINNGWALNYAGLAVGCILFIPFVYRWGRRPVYLFSMLFQLAATIWNAKLNSGGELLAAYTLAGLGGAISETIVQITIADLFFVHQRATANGIFITMQNIGSYVGPVCAGYIVVGEGWRWMWWWAAIFLVVNIILVFFFFEETTYVPTWAGRSTMTDPSTREPADVRDAKLGDSEITKQLTIGMHTLDEESTHDRLSSPERQLDFKPKSYWERMAWVTRTPHQPGDFVKHFYQPFIVLFAFPAVLYAALTYGALLAWYSVLSTIESEAFLSAPYNWDSSQIGLFNMAPFVGSIVGAVIGGPLNDYAIMWMAKKNNGIYEPEMRLWMSLPAVIINPLGILMFGFALANGKSWVIIAVGWALSAVASAMAQDVALTYLTDCYQDIIGTAVIGVVFCRNGISLIIMFVVTPWIDNMGLQNCLISMAVLSFVLGLMPIPLLVWGKKLRKSTAPRYRELSQYQPTKRGAGA